MIVSDWFGLALLILFSALTLCVFSYVVLSGRPSPRARPPEPKSGHPPFPARTLHAGTSNLLTRQPTYVTDEARLLWAGLTRRENQVARLAANKLTDAEIARRLSISERTVGNHLYSIYRKLNINSRHELKYLLQQVDED
jgi:DNA-binding CsgD family transcriptional regulator